MPGLVIALAVLFSSETAELGEPMQVTSAVAPAREVHQPALQTGGEVERLAAELAKPGPEARSRRDSAIAQLMDMKDPAAHQVLQRNLLRTDDHDGVVASILENLIQRLTNDRHPVLGSAVAEAADTRMSYVPALTVLVGSEGTAASERALARQALLGLNSWDRLPVFERLLGANQPRETRLAAARAAGYCQDLGLAQELAAHLGEPDPELHAAIDESLWRLTFVDKGFADRAAFDAWYASVQGKAFVDLAEQAALRARAANRERLTETLLELIDSYVQRPEPKWEQIRVHALADDPPGFTRKALARLRDLLRDTDVTAGASTERNAFFDDLIRRFDASADPDERALLMSVSAALLDPKDAPRRQAMEARLLAALEPSRPAVERHAALVGLRRDPSPDIRSKVVEAAATALQDLDVEGLRAALATLRAPEWLAPSPTDPDHDRWLAVVTESIRRRELPLPVRQDALSLLALRDAEQRRVPGAFETLTGLVSAKDQDLNIRQLALLQLENHVTTPERRSSYLATLEACLVDPARELRERAAQAIGRNTNGPSSGQTQSVTELLQAVCGRVLEEHDAGVHAALMDCLKRVAGDGSSEDVIRALALQVRSLASTPAERREPFWRDNLVDTLRILAATDDRSSTAWIDAAGALVAIKERDAARAILVRHPDSLHDPDPNIARQVRAAVVGAAILRSDDASWADPANIAEAHDVVAACEELQKAGSLSQPGAIPLLIRVQSDLGEDQKAVEQADLWRARNENIKTPEALWRCTAEKVAHSHLALGDLDGARTWLRDALDSTLSPGALSVGEALAQAFADAHRADDALAVLDDLTAHAADGSAAAIQLRLRRAEVLDRSGKDARDDVRALLEQLRPDLDRDGAPADLRQRYLKLRSHVLDGAPGTPGGAP